MTERRNLLLPEVPRWPADRPVIELRGVTKRFGEKTVLDGLDLSITPGQTTVIVGQSGSGKSVLLRLMNGLTLPDAGQVLLFGRDLATISERDRTELRKRCTMVFQNYALIDSLTVFDNIAFPLANNTRMPPAEIARRVDELLEMLGLPHAREMLPASLSGGMKKRVALARAVVSNPEVVLFDEPTTGLDPVMIEFVDELIVKTRQTFEITSVIVSHDMASNRRLADRMAMLDGGRIISTGTFDEVRADPNPAVAAFMGNVVVERMGRDAAPSPGEVAGGAPAGAAPEVERVPPPVVRIRGLEKSFGTNRVLKGVDLDIPTRQITVVIGGSGSGKSVLIKHITGLLMPDAGSVEVFGQNVGDLGTDALIALRARIGMLFQGAALFDSLTVRENIAFPLVERRRAPGAPRLDRKAVSARVEEVAERLKVPHLLGRFPGECSNGERKRVGLARAIITQPEIMIYDEPTTGQDPVMMRRVDDMIVEAAEQFPITSIVISHDMLSTFRIADQVAMVYQGEILAVGPPEQLRASPDSRVQAFIFAGAGDAPAVGSPGATAPPPPP
jgi:ABC-type transporter Mla maintaining outer membrane lipid asymmetry ATPase subunit MlaF